jgi:hypothetical protein
VTCKQIGTQLRQMVMEGRLVELVKEVELKISLSSGWI